MNAPASTNGFVRAADGFDANAMIEVSVLGAIMHTPGLLASLDFLEVDDFHEYKHKSMFQAIRALEARGGKEHIDALAVQLELAKTGRIDAVGANYVELVDTYGYNPELAVEHAGKLRVRRRNIVLLQRLGETLHHAQGVALRDHDQDVGDLLTETIGELERIAELHRGTATERAQARWIEPLDRFLGEHEPDDDDSADWIIRDIVPRAEAVLLGGPMKGGKTWTSLSLALAIATGVPWLGSFQNTLGRPARVLGLFLEDNTRRLRKRLWEVSRAIGVNPNAEALHEHLRLSRAPLRLPDANDQRRFIAEVKAFGAEFVVIDNLTRVMAGDPNKTTDASAFTRAWLEIVEETGASVMFLHHTRKPSGGDQKQIDPFDTLRGSGDFGAAARNIIVTTPIRSEVETPEKLSEVRMRGNLDLRRESFTLAFERKQLVGIDRAVAAFTDKGDLETIKSEVALANKGAKEARKKDEYRRELESRKQLAIRIAQTEKHVSMSRVAEELSLKSANSLKPVFEGLVRDGVLVKCRDTKKGYELADADRQEPIGVVS